MNKEKADLQTTNNTLPRGVKVKLIKIGSKLCSSRRKRKRNKLEREGTLAMALEIGSPVYLYFYKEDRLYPPKKIDVTTQIITIVAKSEKQFHIETERSLYSLIAI